MPIEPFYAQFGDRVEQRRKKLGWTQEALGATLHPAMSRAYIWSVERGRQRVPAHVFLQLCDALSLDPSSFESTERDAGLRSELASKTGLSIEKVASILGKARSGEPASR